MHIVNVFELLDFDIALLTQELFTIQHAPVDRLQRALRPDLARVQFRARVQREAALVKELDRLRRVQLSTTPKTAWAILTSGGSA
jgi:hypothetical protein